MNSHQSEYLVKHYKKKLGKDADNHSAFYHACINKHWDVAKLIYHSVRRSQLNKEDRALLTVFAKELGLPKIAKLSKKNIFTKKSETLISSTNMQLDNEIPTNNQLKAQ